MYSTDPADIADMSQSNYQNPAKKRKKDHKFYLLLFTKPCLVNFCLLIVSAIPKWSLISELNRLNVA